MFNIDNYLHSLLQALTIRNTSVSRAYHNLCTVFVAKLVIMIPLLTFFFTFNSVKKWVA